MKHIFSLINASVLIVTLSATTSFAQMRGAAKESRLWAGPQLGVNVSNFYTDSGRVYNKYKPGFMGGLAVNFAFNNSIGLQTEGNYSSKGGKYKIRTDSTLTQGTFALTYVDVPLLLIIKGGGEDDNAVFFQIGAQQSFLLKAKHTAEITGDSAAVSYSNADVDSLGVPKNDLSLVAGFGMVSTSGLCFTLRATMGLGDIPDKFNKLVTHNLVLSASICYFFGRKHDVIGGRRR